MSYSIGSTIDYGIERYKGVFDKNSPVYNNRFIVEVNFPSTLAITGTEQETLNLLCTAGSIPGKRIASSESTTIRNAVMIPYSLSNDEMSFTFFLGSDYKPKKMFDGWIDRIVNNNTYELAYKNDIVANSWTIFQLDRSNKVVYGEKLYNVMVIQTGPITFANEQASEQQTIEVSITYERKTSI